MGKSFWQDLNKPIWTLAPMEGVTDTVFRQVMIQIGRPGVFYSEFTNVAGICSKGSEVVTQRLMFNKTETPVVAQLWGVQPEQFFKASELVKEMGFSGVDINLGCPVRDVVKLGACSAMIGNESQVREIVDAVKQGAKDLPVSIKTRLGRKKIVTEDWFGFLLTLDLDEITVHGRTADEMSKVPAHWDEIEKVVNLKLEIKKPTIILGNGDVKSLAEAQEKVTKHGVDGVMVGRGALENPWIFTGRNQISKRERLETYLNHVRLWKTTWGDKRPVVELRKFAKAYIREWEGASQLRTRLMEYDISEDLEKALREELITCEMEKE